MGYALYRPSPRTFDNRNLFIGFWEAIYTGTYWAASGGFIGGAAGGVIGAISCHSKPFQIAGKPKKEMQVYLEKLRSKARVPDAQ